MVETDRSGLVGVYICEAVNKVNNKNNEALGGVLLIDEAHSLYKGENTSWDYDNEAIEKLMKRMEDNRIYFAVIAAGYLAPMDDFLYSNEGFKRSFVNYIHFDDYALKKLTQLLLLFFHQNKYILPDEALEKSKKIIENSYIN